MADSKVTSGVGIAGTIEKLPWEISKKILPAASTLMRAWLVVIFGSTTVWEPSLGVPLTSVMGKVLPPLVDNKIFTVAALMGDAVVPATFHKTVRGPDHAAPAAGAV